MMIYQQTMLSSTIEPVSFSSHRSSLSSSFIGRRKISSSSQEQEQPQKPEQDVRSVNFSSCTKKQEAQEKQAGCVKRMNSSRSVPIPECMFRTPSELQLTVDEQVADQRDFAFFARLVSGISERRASSSTSTTNAACATETDRCLTHIIQTRHYNQSHDDQEEEEAEEAPCCDGILIEDDYQVGTGEEGVYFLGEDNDCVTSSSSSSSSSSNSSILYQHEFVDYEEQKAAHISNDDNDDLYNEGGDCECMFDLEL